MTTTEPRFAQPTERRYTSADLVRLTGATYRMIDHWTRTKALLPETANGSGSQRHFSAAELDMVYAAVALISFGMTVDGAFTVARELAAHDRFHKRVGEIFDITITVSSPQTAEEGPS